MKNNYMFTLFVSILLMQFSNVVDAQKIDIELFKGMKARSIGPAGMSGRITSIDVVQKNTDIIYAGTASGGLWRSTSGGVEWEPIFDDQNAASIGAVAVDQNVPDIIWVGTGEGNPRNSQTSGNGVYKSIDGGKTWTWLGLELTKNIHRVIIDPNNSNIVYVAAQGPAWGETNERGIFKTTDGGKTWRKVLFVNEITGAADLIIDPANPNKLVAAMWEFRRWPWFFKSGGAGSGLYISFDGGETWKKKTDKDGLPKGELGRIGLAIAKNNSKIIYALVEAKKNALYKSEDGGFKWEMVTDENVSNRPFYYHEIYVDPENENRIYNLFSNVTMSEDGGKTFRTLIGSSDVHPDHHAWWINPQNGKHIIEGNDGGLNISYDRGKSWRFIGNLPLGQFYHINVDNETPYNVYGGLQDNGSWRGPSKVLSRGGIKNSFWEEVGFGDGFDAALDQLNSRYVYYMSQGGNLGRYDLTTGDQKNIQPIHPYGKKIRFNWNAGFAQDPLDKKIIYYGSQYLHKSSDMGNTWEIISSDLTTNDSTKQKQNQSGGLTYDVTNAENFTTIISIAPSPVKTGIIWVGTDDGNLQLTKNGGKSWENVIKNVKGVPDGTWIPQIRASVYDEGEAFVVINNYRRNDWKPYVYQTKDFGRTWSPVVKENDVSGYALSFIQDPVKSNLYFLGTEFGLYFSIDAGKTWTKWVSGYPTVSTMDLAIQPRENDLVIGTFGRSVFVLDNIQPLRELADQGSKLLNNKLKMFAVPDAYQYEIKQAPGMRFTASAEYKGENLPDGAMLSFYVNPDSTKENDKVKFEIYNSENKLVRTLEEKFDKGFNRIFWNFERKGVRFPGPQRQRGAFEPPGPKVIPGQYKVKITHGKNSDSAFINVNSDPRLDVNLNYLVEREKMLNEFESKIDSVVILNNKISSAIKTVTIIEEKLKDKKEKELKALLKTCKSVKDTLKSLDQLINQEEVQGIRTDETKLGYILRRAHRAISGYWDKPGEREKIYLEQADKSIADIVGQINSFFEKEWIEYRNKVEELKISLFSNN